MPTYEFRCNDCGAKLERFQKLEDFSVDIKCPYCKGDTHKIISLSVPMLFQSIFDEQTDLKFTGHRQKSKALQRAGFEEKGVWTKDMIEERRYKRKEKREKRQKRQQERGEILTNKRQTENHFDKRTGGR